MTLIIQFEFVRHAPQARVQTKTQIGGEAVMCSMSDKGLSHEKDQDFGEAGTDLSAILM